MIRAFGLALLAVWQGAVACPPPATDSSRLAISGGSITEIVYLLNESAKIVAADRTSNYPTAATKLPSIGYVRNLSAEGVLSICLLYTSPSPRDVEESRMPSSA